LSQECKAWLPEGEEEIRKDLFEDLLTGWQLNTLAQQDEAVGPFLHPHFIRANAPRKWSDIQCTTLTSGRFEENRELAEQRLRNIIRRKIQRAHRKQERSGVPEGVTIEEGKGFSYSELNTLRVPDTRRNNASYLSKMRARIAEAEFPQEKDEKEKVKADLELCHEVMHEQVHRIAQEALGRELTWSTLIGIPLSLAYSEGETDITVVPRTYRGGVWLFAGGCSCEWALEQEETLFDFARLLWMLYNGKYNAEAAKDAARSVERETALRIGHRLPGTLQAIVRSLQRQKRDGVDIKLPAEAYLLSNTASIQKGDRPNWSVYEDDEDFSSIVQKLWAEVASTVGFARVRGETNRVIKQNYRKANAPELEIRGHIEFSNGSERDDLISLICPLLIEAYQHAYFFGVYRYVNEGQSHPPTVSITLKKDRVSIVNPCWNPGGQADPKKLLQNSTQKNEISDIERIIEGSWSVEFPSDEMSTNDDWTVTITRSTD